VSERRSSAPTPTPPAGDETNAWLTLAVLCLSVFMLLIDSTIVNVAQRKIQEGLNANLSEIQWILDAYILTYAVLLLSCGRMGDVFGRKRLFLLGLAIFTTSSALCGVSDWLAGLTGLSGSQALIAARVLQGVGGGAMMPQALSLITVVFPRDRRGAALGIWSSVVALGAIVGPVFGGFIVTNFAWEWIFLVNVPVGIGAFIAGTVILPESIDPFARNRLDWMGVFLSTTGIFAFVYAMIESNGLGWTDPRIPALIAVSAVLLATFLWWERRHPDPMMKLELFTIRNFWAGGAIRFVSAFALFGISFPLQIFLQAGVGYSPLESGLTIVPQSIMIIIVAPIAGRLADRIGARWLMFCGLLTMSGGILFLLSQTGAGTTWRSLILPLAVYGGGIGLTFSPLTTAAMKDVPLGIAGSASGVLNTMRSLGQVLGIAVLGSVLQTRLAADMGKQLAGSPLPAGIRDHLAALTGAIRIEEIPAALGQAYARLLPAVMADLHQALISATRTTFLVSAVTVALAAMIALLIENPDRLASRAPAAEEQARVEAEVSANPAD
jgi:EmrB/QacA subfamily drug resistance transporter